MKEKGTRCACLFACGSVIRLTRFLNGDVSYVVRFAFIGNEQLGCAGLHIYFKNKGDFSISLQFAIRMRGFTFCEGEKRGKKDSLPGFVSTDHQIFN